MNSSKNCALKASDLTVAYHDNVVLRHVDVAIPVGELAAVIGPNGAGKSTLIKAALGLVTPLAGQTQFFGEDLSTVRTRVGYMPQSTEVDWDFPTTVGDVVAMGTYGKLGWIRRFSRDQLKAVQKSMEDVGVEELADRQISALSGGQKRRVFLARILAQDPDLFIMDEPFAGVDVKSQRVIMNVLKGLQQRGKTILIVHHDLASVRSFASWVTLLSNGSLVACGPTSEAFTNETIGQAYGLENFVK